MNIADFIHQTTWDDLPPEVRTMTRRCLLDTAAAGIGGRRTDLSRIIFDFAAAAYGGRGAQLWLDGREVSPPGAALANGMTVDALDIHDGHPLTKGHAGAAIIPAAFAMVKRRRAAARLHGAIDGREFLATIAVGYEIAVRAGMALHATACDYHTSGAWNALGCAAMTARRLKLNAEQTRHALGIAEYHGPRSPMMRCIDYPTMLKDGSGWGAMAGVSAGLMARGGFTGAPALTVEAPESAAHWNDLGAKWHMLDQYFKPYAVCYWAQAAVAGALSIQRAQNLPLDAIEKIRVRTFHQATRLDRAAPRTTEEAQYSLPFPVAAALVHRQLGPDQLGGAALDDPVVLGLSARVELVEDDGYNARFPAERLARVEIETKDGRRFDSGEHRPKWFLTAPASDDELLEKFRWLAKGGLSSSRAALLEMMLWHCDEISDAGELAAQLALA